MMRSSENYKSLPAQTSQQILRLLDRSWLSFFRAIKEWKKHPEKFMGRPKLPKYREKDGEFILIFTNQQCRIEDGILNFPKKIELNLKTRIEKLREVRIVPKGVGYEIEIVYEKEIADQKRDTAIALAIDVGVSNIVTIVDSIGGQPIAVKGGIVKSMNQYYNKTLATLKRIADMQDITGTKRIAKLNSLRDRKISGFMHKTSKGIVQYALSLDVDTIVIGHNDGWKQSIGIGKRNNQNFVQIPFNRLMQQIKYKAEERGINVTVMEESHTSKCSFLDNESIEHHEKYLGRRIKRGLFRTSEGILINADVNGAYNIGKKAFPKLFNEGIEGVGLHPRSLSVSSFETITSKGVC